MSTPSPAPPPRRLTRKQQRRQELIDTKLFQIRPTRPSGAAVVVTLALAVLWAVLGIDAAFSHPLLELGIKPRQLDGLPGIVLAPVLHASAAQLAALTIPFAALGWLMLTSGLRYLAIVTVAAVLASGLVGWLAGPSDQVIVGVTGVVLGWLGYLLARAVFGRKVLWIAVAVAVGVVFSGLFNGLLPRVHDHEFWGSQLASFAVGVV
ncbi:MAG TPA: rhomboid family intramembrane serine protease, partial [Jatrophihabitans sp.]